MMFRAIGAQKFFKLLLQTIRVRAVKKNNHGFCIIRRAKIENKCPVGLGCGIKIPYTINTMTSIPVKKIHEITSVHLPEKERAADKKPPVPESAQWTESEFDYEPKGVSWYWISVIVCVALIFFGAVSKNFLFIVFVMIAEVLVLFWGNEKPRPTSFGIDASGLRIDRTFYPYSSLDWFALVEEEQKKELIIARRSKILPPFHIAVDSADTLDQVRSVLKGKLREKKDYEDHLIDLLAKLFRF